MRSWMVCVASGLTVLACDSDSSGPSERAQEKDSAVEASVEPLPGMNVLAPGESYGGKSAEEWAKEYVRWFYSPTSCKSAANDEDGSQCGLYQDPESPVFFFERAPYSVTSAPITTRTLCRVPAGKALVVPIALFALDNVGVDPPLTDGEVRQAAEEIKRSMRQLFLAADGREIEALEERGVGPAGFSYRVPPAPNFYSCSQQQDVADTVIEPNYAVGYLAIVEPPTPGKHELEYSSMVTFSDTHLAYHVKTSFVVDDANE